MFSNKRGLAAAALTLSALHGCTTKPTTKTNPGYQNPSQTALNEATAFAPGFTKISPNTPNSVEVTISGETLGENGLPFVPVNVGDPVFIDGWSVSFTHYIVVIGNIRLSPDALQYADQNVLNPTTCSAYDSSGCAVQRKGPYVIDVHNLSTLGLNGFVGADGQEPASGIFGWNQQDNGQPFDTSTLYAFSYNTVQAAFPATNVNLTDDEFAIYQTMVQNGWDKYIEGTATYVGTCDCPDPTTCDQPAPGSTTGMTIRQEFQAVDAVSPVAFHFGWDDHTTSLNCINPFNGDMDEANLANRGIQTNSSGAVIAQVTIHTDHVFWDKLKQEGTPLRMDPLTAWATAGTELDIGSLATKPYAPVTFADGAAIPDRGICQNNQGVLGYTQTDQDNPAQISLSLNGVPAANIKGIANFMAMSAQSQTHLNANGLCYIEGQNAPDPWFLPNAGP